jgi:hypothetical protein
MNEKVVGYLWRRRRRGVHDFSSFCKGQQDLAEKVEFGNGRDDNRECTSNPREP